MITFQVETITHRFVMLAKIRKDGAGYIGDVYDEKEAHKGAFKASQDCRLAEFFTPLGRRAYVYAKMVDDQSDPGSNDIVEGSGLPAWRLRVHENNLFYATREGNRDSASGSILWVDGERDDAMPFYALTAIVGMAMYVFDIDPIVVMHGR